MLICNKGARNLSSCVPIDERSIGLSWPLLRVPDPRFLSSSGIERFENTQGMVSKMNKNTRNALLAIVLICSGVLVFDYLKNDRIFFGLFDEDKEEVVIYSAFKFTGVREDATGTTVTGATSRVWFDENSDGVMQYSELGTFTESSGVYTSDQEYPIGLDYDLWVQLWATTYQLTYANFHMTGQRNAGGEAKSVGQLEVRLTDDSMTYDGSMNGVPFDTTDYNYTLSGATGNLKAEIVLSAADYGISSQVWEGVNYKTVYGVDRDNSYYVRWDAISEGTGDTLSIAKASVMAPTFFAAYCTIQDKVDVNVAVSSFDFNFNDGVSWFFIKELDSSFGDLMYNTADDVAPRPFISIGLGTIGAAGTFAATYGIGLWQDVTYDNMMSGAWTKGTALALGTSGDGWAWIV